MAYADVDTAARATRASGDLLGRIGVALLRKAYTTTVAQEGDQRENNVIRQVVSGTYPAAWTTAVLYALDTSGQLAAPTDAQINTAVGTAWAKIVMAG